MSAAVRAASKGTLGVETFGGETRARMRLASNHERDLRAIFCEAEASAGVRTTYWASLERQAGIVAAESSLRSRAGADDVHLFAVERWCDAQGVWASNGRGAHLRRARRALVAMGDAGQGGLVVALHRVYGSYLEGPAPPNVPVLHFGRELAALVEYTDVVEERRLALRHTLLVGRLGGAEAGRVVGNVRLATIRADLQSRIAGLSAKIADAPAWLVATADRVRSLRAKAAKAQAAGGATHVAIKRERRSRRLRREARRLWWQIAKRPALIARWGVDRARLEAQLAGIGRDRLDPAQECSAAKIRQGADREVTRADALADALRVHVDKRVGESKPARRARVLTASAERNAFILDARRQAEQILVAASEAYLRAWWKAGW